MAASRRSALGALLGLLLALGSISACRSTARRGDGTAAPSASSAAAKTIGSWSGVAPAPSATAGGEASTLDEARVRRFVTLWVEAQNAHDFTAYSALYAERFTG